MRLKFRGNGWNLKLSPTPLHVLSSSLSSSLVLQAHSHSHPRLRSTLHNRQAMLPRIRILPGLIPRRPFSVSAKMASATPMEDLMRDKVALTHFHTPFLDLEPLTLGALLQIAHAFTPTTLIIRNDSHLHADHAPMQGVTSNETHFQCVVTLHDL